MLAAAALLAVPTLAGAGAFVFADETNGVDVVTHPPGYLGAGGTLAVSVCIDPTSANAAAMEAPVRNIVKTWNQRVPVTGNVLLGASNDVPTGNIDFESVALHELGHCIGVEHPNLGSESGLGEPQVNATRSTDGADDVFDTGSGVDGVHGSSDDVRDDDVNLHWFRKSNNDPFTLATPVDSSTYSRDVADLPGGHAYPANGDRDVASLLGVPNTEAVMQQGTMLDEAQRRLAHDDVATLQYGMSGLDETAGTLDDYSVSLSYVGLTTSCDVVFDFDDAETGFAVCDVAGNFIGATDHVQVTSANVYFNSGYTWYFTEDDDALITQIIDITGDGTGNAYDFPSGAATDASGNVYLTGTNSKNAFRITPGGVITEIIDETGDGSGNVLDGSGGVMADASGNVYVGGRYTDNVFKIVNPVACGTGGTPCTITEIIDATGDGGGNILNNPEGIAVDASGNVFVAGTLSANAFKITPGGTVTEIIDATGDGLGNTLSGSHGITTDASGNVYLSGFWSDNVFKITPGGAITEIIDATGDGVGNLLDGPEGVVVDASGNVYVGGAATNNVFRITPGGSITEIIDSTGDTIGNTMFFPSALAIDSAGSVYLSALNTHNAFEITTPGSCSTGGTPCTITEIIDGTGDGAGNALTSTIGIAVDSNGVAYVVGRSTDNAFRITKPPEPVAHEESETGTSSGSASVSTSASLTGVADHLYLAAVSYRPDTSVTGVSGLGLSWTLVAEQCSGDSETGVSVWQALGAPSGDGVVTATLAASVSRAVIAVTRHSGVQGAAAVAGVVSGNTNGVGGGCSGGSDTSSYSFGVPISTGGARAYGAVATRQRSHTPGSGFTEQAEVQSGNGGQAAGVAVEDQVFGAPTTATVDGSLDGNADWAFVGLEIVAAECSFSSDCDDGLFCNGSETCSAGSCVAGAAVVCDDAVSCTLDACNETLDQCDTTPDDGLCDDTLFCNGAETCHATNDCQAGSAVDCTDAVACTVDVCNETLDQCDNTPNDGFCDDTLYCNGAETCHATLDCQSGSTVDCDDAVSCTTDACNETLDQCDNTPVDALCVDGDVCTEDVCHATLDCQNDPIAQCIVPVPASTDWSRLALVLILLGATIGGVEILSRRPGARR